ncbi:alpha/beta fold hydrolase [Alicyclobacillus sp. SO9]|uniref:alpha/beta hydrolase family protein n=1 Tax=Alicyclobacillus sp. SO9 TaxID=2665646 RepID=UPI0018E8AEDE|nr:alpha/beta fold hydrolase [Alicyclobacillus sp. SO9]QQE79213.1 alpha/beta fold hydrolase [Alicyclobacillus sp. SO9]
MKIGINTPTPVISVKPVVLPAPNRGDDLQVRVCAPAVGHELPIVVFSHGFGLSSNSYDPLVDFWAAHGFVVIQPTHLDSMTLNLPPEDPRTPTIWRFRVEDVKRILDELDFLEAAVPGLHGRLNRDRIAVAGHSWGGQTVSMLLGARVLNERDEPGEDMSDSRIKAGVLLATPGKGGADLTPFATEYFPFMNPSFSDMRTPALVIAGDHDKSELSTRGPDWFTDPYFCSPGSKSLLTLFGAEHSLGGIIGYNDTRTTDENPKHVSVIQRFTWGYLRQALNLDDSSLLEACAALEEGQDALGRFESK